MRSVLVLALLVAAAVAVDLDETRLGKRHHAPLDYCALARTVSRAPELRAPDFHAVAVAMAANASFVRRSVDSRAVQTLKTFLWCAQ
jgi:hypothetical protein